MDRSRFRGPTPEKSIKTPNITIPEKDLKKILVKINLKKPSASSQLDEIDHTLDRPEEIKIYRSQGEGSRPLFAREDIKVNSEDVETTSRRSHRTESDYTRRSSDYSNNRETPKRSRSRERDRRSHYRSRSRSQDSLRRNYVNKPSSSSSRRDYESHSRNRRSRSPRRSRTRSRSRSSRREFGRRRNSPERRHRYDRQDYRHHDRRHRRSRSPPRSHSRYPSHSTPLDPAAIGAIPLIFPPDLNFYGHEDGMWFQAPIRGPPPPMMIPRGLIPSRGMFRAPLYGMRPPVPPRPPPYLYPQRLPEYNSLQREAFERSRRLP